MIWSVDRVDSSHLAPGGYAEFIDFDGHYTSPDGSLKETSDIGRLNKVFIETALAAGMDPSPGPHFEGWLKDAGFEHVIAERKPLPIGTWPADQHLVRLSNHDTCIKLIP